MMSPRTQHIRGLTVLVIAGAVGLMVWLLPVSPVSAAPAAPSIPDLAPASDTGLSDTDNITVGVIDLVFTGTAEPGSTVKIYVGGITVIGSAVTSAGGAYSITTIVALPDDASNSITATATDGTRESVASPSLNVVTDRTAPSAPSTPDLDAASDTGVSSTDNITSDTTPTFSGTSEAGAQVQLFGADGPAVGSTITSGTSWTITSSALSAGSYSFRAIQIDAAGNDASPLSGGLSVTITTSVPAPPSTPDLEAASDSGPSTTDNVTFIASPSFSGTAEAGSVVELFAGTTLVGTGTATSGSWQITSSALSPGTYAFTAKATNVAGTSASSGALSVVILAGKYIVTPSTATPGPSTSVTITAQLADAANAPIATSGVVVAWSSTGLGGALSPATSTTNASGLATTTLTVGPTAGATYTVTATSPGPITGTSANIIVTLPSASLTLTSDLPTTMYRESVTLNAQFSGTGGGGRLIAFQRMTASLPGTWATIGTATTTLGGRATLTYGPPFNSQFRAVFAGATDLAAITSNPITVNVRYKVTLRPGGATTAFVATGTRVTYTATVRPIAPTGLQRVTFLVYKRVNGIWTFRTSATVSTVSGVGSFSWRWSRGQWYIRARANATSYNVTAYSNLSGVSVR